MIKVKSTVKLNAPLIRKLEAAQKQALVMTAEALHTEVVQAEVVPRKIGTLQNEAFFVDDSKADDGKVSLIHATPYARRLYFHPEYHFHKEPWEEVWTGKDGKIQRDAGDGNPNAKGKWFEDWVPGGSQEEFAINAYKKIFRRLAGL